MREDLESNATSPAKIDDTIIADVFKLVDCVLGENMESENVLIMGDEVVFRQIEFGCRDWSIELVLL